MCLRGRSFAEKLSGHSPDAKKCGLETECEKVFDANQCAAFSLSGCVLGTLTARAEICRHSPVYLSATNELSLLNNK